MTKSLIVALALTLALPIFSVAATCEGEAQIIAAVKEVRTNSLTYCNAIVDAAAVTHYSASGVCPLPLARVIAEGIEFPLQNGHDCEVPETISGVLVLSHGRIYLE